MEATVFEKFAILFLGTLELESSYSPDIDPSNTNKIHPTVQAPAYPYIQADGIPTNQFFIFKENQNV
jgi:hypothetical protein